MKYIIACDLDGTLLKNSTTISDKTKSILEKASKIGHKVVIATGRSFSGSEHIYNELKLNTPMINNNGGFIHTPNSDDFEAIRFTMPLNLAKKVFEFTKENLISAIHNVDKQIYSYNYSSELDWLFNGAKNRDIVDGLFKDDIAPTGMIFLINATFLSTLEEFVNNETNDIIAMRSWSRSNEQYAVVEIYSKSVSKYTGLEYLLDYFGKDKYKIISFGDGVNDLEMVKESFHGVAMKNAVDELKEVANDVTNETNVDDGLAVYLENYLSL